MYLKQFQTFATEEAEAIRSASGAVPASRASVPRSPSRWVMEDADKTAWRQQDAALLASLDAFESVAEGTNIKVRRG